MRINSVNNQLSVNKSRTTAFKGATTQAAKIATSETKKIPDAFIKFYQNHTTKPLFQNIVAKFSRSDKTFTHLVVMESFILSSFYMINTLTNKKIKKEQKPQMLINDTLTFGVATTGAYLLEDKLTSGVKKLSENYFAKNADYYTELGIKEIKKAGAESNLSKLLSKAGEIAESGKDNAAELGEMMAKHLKNITAKADAKTLKTFQVTPDKIESAKEAAIKAVTENTGNKEKAAEAVSNAVKKLYESSAARTEADSIYQGINKLKVIVILGLIYRYLGPVLITPLANKISSKLFENKHNKSDNKQVNKPEEKK